MRIFMLTAFRFLLTNLDDVLLLAGCVCILIGLSLWSVIATWIAAGVMSIAIGLMIAKEKANAAID